LLADLDAMLTQAGVRMSEIELFAVASGPGSFTGLRIGLATVKGLATTMDRPCIGVPTLEAIAHAAGESDGTVSLLPAGRGEVFAQMFSVSADGNVVPLDEAVHISPVKAIERYLQNSIIVWAGPAAQANGDLIREVGNRAGRQVFERHEDVAQGTYDSWRIAQPTTNLAQHVAYLALSRIESAEQLSPIDLRAIYVRPSDAELKF
jgi:tRNA threonylcarbamoyladenosine biosynthesis protein TsaB